MSSLRPDDRGGRGRSSSRTRSHSRDARAPSPAAPMASSSNMPGQYGGGLVDSDSENEITMGGYTDLPPEQRPSYNPPPSNTKGAVSYSTNIANNTYTPNAQWGYNAPTTTSEQIKYRESYMTHPPGRGRGYNYEEVKGYSYSARPQFRPDPLPRSPTEERGRSDSYSSSPPSALPYPMGDHAFPPPPQAVPVGMSGLPPSPLGPPPVGGLGGLGGPGGLSSAGANIREVVPPPSPGGLRPHRGSTNGPRPDIRAPSPRLGLDTRMDRLSVSGNRPDIHAVVGGERGLPPPSPLLEAYKGTWQSISPMPSPIARPYDDDDLDGLPPLSPRVSRTSIIRKESYSRRSPERKDPYSRRSPERKESFTLRSPEERERERVSIITKTKKKVSMYAGGDAEVDAKDIAEELSRSHPDVHILIDILPTLSHDQMLELRSAYKHVAKVQGRGINIAKHIKLKTSGNFQKICYVAALGRWESEGYWANYWYQSNSARRELLIEALMGRSNAEIRQIKDSFKDKRYGDSLSRCMDKELKADKFRVAVLMVLEERRQEENDVWPTEYRNRDVDALYEALRRRDGGETAILEIVIRRSNAHLREVLKTYERKYGGNFAKDALKKSNNLVGEVIAHILNGVINRPARDAMLLHHALIDLAPTKEEATPRTSRESMSKDRADRKDRYELLISRLVRFHWERMHLMRVKDDYQEKYRHSLEEDIEYYVKGDDFKEFCLGLCEGGK